MSRYSNLVRELNFSKVSRSRMMATIADSPLDKKVEMTNWEKV